MERENLLIVADSEHDANMLYAVGMFVPDPFIYLRVHGKCHIVMNDLEIDRARKQAKQCRVISLSQCQKKLRSLGESSPNLASVIRLILRENRLKKILVPNNFPHGLARELRRRKIKVKVREYIEAGIDELTIIPCGESRHAVIESFASEVIGKL